MLIAESIIGVYRYMENQRFNVIHPEEIFFQTKEQPLETDILLPDYYPEISKILDCSVTLQEEAVTLTADKISISGAAKFTLLYASAENELQIYETVSKYTKLITGSGFEPDDICLVDQTVGTVNYRAVSPRKMEIRGAAAVKVSVIRKTETQCLCEITDERVQARHRVADVFQMHSFSASKLEIKEEIGLPDSNKSIRSVFNVNTKITFNESKAVSNKLMLNGSAEVSFMYISAENNVIGTHIINMPFTKIVDVNGVQENDICYVFVKNVQASIDYDKNDPTGANASVKIEAQLVFVTGTDIKISYIDDVYAVNGGVRTAFNNIHLCNNVAVQSVYPAFEGELQTYDVTGGDIVDKSVKDITCGITFNAEQINISGGFTLRIVVKSADGQYFCVSRNCLYSEQYEIRDAGCFHIAAASFGSVSAEFCREGVLKFRGNLAVNLLQLCGNDAKIVSDAVFTEKSGETDREKIVLYYGMKGENVWNIAKENKTPVIAMRELNALDSDVLKEDKLLVFWN